MHTHINVSSSAYLYRCVVSLLLSAANGVLSVCACAPSHLPIIALYVVETFVLRCEAALFLLTSELYDWLLIILNIMSHSATTNPDDQDENNEDSPSSQPQRSSQTRLLRKIYYPDTLYPDSYTFFTDRSATLANNETTHPTLATEPGRTSTQPETPWKPSSTEIEIIEREPRLSVSCSFSIIFFFVRLIDNIIINEIIKRKKLSPAASKDIREYWYENKMKMFNHLLTCAKESYRQNTKHLRRKLLNGFSLFSLCFTTRKELDPNDWSFTFTDNAFSLIRKIICGLPKRR